MSFEKNKQIQLHLVLKDFPEHRFFYLCFLNYVSASITLTLVKALVADTCWFEEVFFFTFSGVAELFLLFRSVDYSSILGEILSHRSRRLRKRKKGHTVAGKLYVV